ncbi:hypothetical protein RJ639_027802 [Escallonia herrerae]|uniref:beta-fructofuranosidase n=1 Tax=Escallonia herrerae TaxID=1293975 RepID=A0AA88X5S9_9ASTE|nr:hypothetical protein RJ639_027802 [Escallonia herrerae]
MGTITSPTSSTTPNDLERAYTPLPDQPEPLVSPAGHRRPMRVLSSICLSVLFLSSLVLLILTQQGPEPTSNADPQESLPLTTSKWPANLTPPSRGVSQGVSEKAFRQFSDVESYPWTNAMLSWQRTSYHFQPEKNWMNGPLFHMGWYHLFYQYNPDSAVWGNITWGHAVSRDLISWLYLPFAMVPDEWFDISGVWTGSATILPDGEIIILYTGDTSDSVQVQNLAYPANLSDPLLLDWVKYPGNPVMIPPPGIKVDDFRDPTTAWSGPDGKWRVTIGSKVNKTGIALLYETTNFTSYQLLEGVMHAVPGTGMWECVDFYPVSTTGANGLDTSANGPGIKHVLKASLDDNKHDYYALGTFNPISAKWTPDDPELDVGIGLRVDYGKYYASKTFYDQNKGRRILWGWIGETDSETADILKGWASVQTIPRTVVFDDKTGSNILQWPVEEAESLRLSSHEFDGVELGPGSVVPLDIGSATQLDITVTFEVNEAALGATVEADVGYNCTTSGGAAGRGILGPFGILVLADESISELTPVYFYIAKGTDGSASTYFCADESRSSKATDVGKLVYGSIVPVLDGEKLSARLLEKEPINEDPQKASTLPEAFSQFSTGDSTAASETTCQQFCDAEVQTYLWTNAMLSWQRTTFHFQPQKNWMNDPSAPLFHMGWYHLFYQYNPYSAVWGNMTWGHAVSRDLINWLYLPFAMVRDNWYDANGVWTGSATILPDGQIIVLYTGVSDDSAQVQNLAYPANLSDPLLLDWVKYPNNPVMVPPPGIGLEYFRDPSTAWIGPDGKWRVMMGSKVNTTGIALLYKTSNFTSFELLDGVVHAVRDTGMWEFLDFFPVSMTGTNGLDTCFTGPGIKHVLKAGLYDNLHDYYVLGSYDPITDKWTPDDPDLGVGIGLRVDYGEYYASKSFYDQSKGRRILWAWIPETDNRDANLLKGWASVQSIPRTVVLDDKTERNILQWPVEEVESLRTNSHEFEKVELGPGSLVPLDIVPASELDITATFEINEEALDATVEGGVGYNCTTSGGSVQRGISGPFGLIVLADEAFSELTPVYFYIAKGIDRNAKTFFCADGSRSSLASDVGKLVYGSEVPVLHGEKFSMRLLVDRSIVESFAQGGRTVITSRVYPTKAIYGAAKVFLFNNATGVKVTASVKIWHMRSADLHPFPFDEL